MQAPLQKKTEIKVYILYILKNIGYAVDFNTLNDAVTSDELVNYFNFSECFAELVDTGNIAEDTTENTPKFIITSQGIHVADNLLYMLIPGVQRSALACATRLTSFEKRGATVTSGHTEDGKGYIYSFSIEEKGEKLLDLKIRIANKEQLERIEANMKTNADNSYKSIMALLNGQANYLI